MRRDLGLISGLYAELTAWRQLGQLLCLLQQFLSLDGVQLNVRQANARCRHYSPHQPQGAPIAMVPFCRAPNLSMPQMYWCCSVERTPVATRAVLEHLKISLSDVM